MTWLPDSLNPRKHVVAAVGWAVGATAVLCALLAAIAVMLKTQSDLEQDAAQLFAAQAGRLAESLDTRIVEKQRTITASAVLLGVAQKELPTTYVTELTKDAGNSLHGFDWIGTISQRGDVVADSDGSLLGVNTAAQPWFAGALDRPLISLGQLKKGEAQSLIFTAPMDDRTASERKLLVGRLSLNWLVLIEEMARRSLRFNKNVEIAIVAKDGSLLAGNWKLGVDQALPIIAALEKKTSDDQAETSGTYDMAGEILGYGRTQGPTIDPADDWWVLMRETSSAVYGKALSDSRWVFLTVLGSGFLTTLVAGLLAALLLKRLNSVAESAKAIQDGTATTISAPSGRDEIAVIGASLAATFNNLLNLNRELDQRVEERTREVHRLFEENKNAAVTRERLRLSRDLHDTLAHSMLAALTQIKLARKVEKAKPELLSSELAEAERVASEGLQLARGAVGQLRHVAVRDEGLGPALRKLALKLQERIAVNVTLDLDPSLEAMADRKAETIHRIAEEAMRNIEKHAQASAVTLKLSLVGTGSGAICLDIVDDGIGFDPAEEKRGHYGLLGLHEQAQLIDGKLAIESRAGHGTRLFLTVPLMGAT